MADKVSKVPQIDWQKIVLKVLLRLLPVRYRNQFWTDFSHTGKSPQQIVRLTLSSIPGIIGSQTTEPYYKGMFLVEMLTISASLIARLTPFSAGIVAGAVSGLLLLRDAYMDRGKKGYARFLWDAVTAIGLLVVFQAFAAFLSSDHLRAAAPWIAAQSLAGGASASFFRLIFKMPPDPFERAFEDYQPVLYVNLVWWFASMALFFWTVNIIPLPYHLNTLLIVSQATVVVILIRLQSDRLGGVAAPQLLSLGVHPVKQEAQIRKDLLPQPPQTLQRRLLEIGFFVLLAVPFAFALWLWWTRQDTGIKWRQVLANAVSLSILSILWIWIRALNAETVKALDEKVKEELQKLEKPPEKTDHDV